MSLLAYAQAKLDCTSGGPVTAFARYAISVSTILGTALLGGCFTFGDARQPIEMLLVPGPAHGAPSEAVVLLPGFGTDAKDMREHEIDQAVHKAWPDADLLLTSATFAYYSHGQLVARLESDVMGPAQARYKKVVLAGASMGGMGALMYENAHPGQVAELVLFAPFLGDGKLLDEIRAAGGVRAWTPGPVPEKIDGDNYQREMWRTIKSWSDDPAKARRIWLVCGKDDHLLEAVRLAATALPPSHYLEVEGGHSWKAWAASAEQVMARIRSAGPV